jgi:hypothetical protein
MPAGRPREHDREQIAKDLIEWAKKPDSINLCKFCAYYEPIIPPSKMSAWALESTEFRQSYDAAKMFLGFRREEWLNKEQLHVKAYDLNAKTYDYFLKEEAQHNAIFAASLNKEEKPSNTQYTIKVDREGIATGVSTEILSAANNKSP